MTNKIKLKPGAINTLKTVAFKWNMTAWERKFVEDVLLSEYVYRGISEKQYSKLNDIASRNDYDLATSIQSAVDESTQYEGVINILKAVINANSPIRLGTSYDFAKRSKNT